MAGVVAVPSRGKELTGEVAFRFARLDEIEAQGELIRSTPTAAAAEIAASADAERRRILAEAHAECDRVAAELLAHRRVGTEQRVTATLADARRHAARVHARGRERTPVLVARSSSGCSRGGK